MATFTVTRYDDVVDSNDGQTSLPEAVNQAIASSGDDTINLNQIAQVNQPIVITANSGRITFQGNGTNTSGFSGQDRTQIITVHHQALATFSNLGFYNGYAYGGRGGGGAGLGGAVFVTDGGRFTVRDSSFSNNSATGGTGNQNGQGRGGAIFVQSGGVIGSNNIVTFFNNAASTGDRDSNVYPVKVNRGDGTIAVEDFTGVGRGDSPSEEVLSTFDELVFKGADLIAKNLLLTQVGIDLEVSFEGVDNTKVILKDFALENLDNLPIPGGQHGQVGNIVFGDSLQLQDNIDVFDADSTQDKIWNRNTVTFLNDLDNDVRGFANSDDVINGQGGNDNIRGLNGDDLLRGGGGNDVLDGGVGADILIGNAGDDTLLLGGNRDVDTVIYRMEMVAILSVSSIGERVAIYFSLKALRRSISSSLVAARSCI